MRLALGFPAYKGQVHVQHVPETVALVASILATQGRVQWGGCFTVESACVAHARNHLVYEAMRAGAEWLLMIDADTFYVPPGDRIHPAIPMVLTARSHGCPVIAAPVRRRHSGTYNATVSTPEGAVVVEREGFAEKVVDVHRAGTAYMAIDLGWLQAKEWTSPWFVMEFPKTEAPSWVGEDFGFCDGVHARGGRVLLDGRFEPEHR